MNIVNSMWKYNPKNLGNFIGTCLDQIIPNSLSWAMMVFYVVSFKHRLPPYNMFGYNNWSFHLHFNHIWETPLYFFQHHACVNTHTYFDNNPIPIRQIQNTPISIPLLWKCLQKEQFQEKINTTWRTWKDFYM
jgi:hypothetical protein